MSGTSYPPPGWYENPQGNGLRYWDGGRWTEHVQARDSAVQPSTTPRSTAVHVLLFIGLWLGIILVAVIIGAVIGAAAVAGGAMTGASEAQFDDAAESASNIWMLFILGVGALMASKVGYRWFDTFGLLVPILSVIWLVRWMWRFTSLPHRYWSERAT